jgi:hypothetical protein
MKVVLKGLCFVASVIACDDFEIFAACREAKLVASGRLHSRYRPRLQGDQTLEFGGVIINDTPAFRGSYALWR